MTQPQDDLDRWLAELAGQDMARGARSEPQALRRVILNEASQQEQLATDDDQATEQLLFRLRREGLLKRRRIPAWGYALAATLAAAAIGLVVLRESPSPAPEGVAYGEPPIWRGAFAQFEVRGRAPRASAEKLVGALRAEGVQADIYALGAIYTVDTELAAPLSAAVQAQFQALGIAVKPGRVRVEFKP
ncbi:hypothetical protein [Niveibacterium sp.]|uniref:hypothetical protein n=1 Tax=Niveibacterium sp. TaxID=2017444 RepID=UPI0035B0D945